jgi:hypothetical protein
MPLYCHTTPKVLVDVPPLRAAIRCSKRTVKVYWSALVRATKNAWPPLVILIRSVGLAAPSPQWRTLGGLACR